MNTVTLSIALSDIEAMADSPRRDRLLYAFHNRSKVRRRIRAASIDEQANIRRQAEHERVRAVAYWNDTPTDQAERRLDAKRASA